MFRLAFIVPMGFFLFSIGYLAFILTLDSTVMIGDTYGYDPGGALVPASAAVLLGLAALWQLITRHPVENGDRTKAPVGLLLSNIAISAVFIAVFRYAGFLLSTGIALHLLIQLNLWTENGRQDLKNEVAGLAITIIYLTAMYAVLRGVIKMLFWLARHFDWLFCRDPALQAGLGALVLAGLIYLVGRLLARICRTPAMVALIQTSVGMSLAIYVIFRLLFLVQLPAGLLAW